MPPTRGLTRSCAALSLLAVLTACGSSPHAAPAAPTSASTETSSTLPPDARSSSAPSVASSPPTTLLPTVGRSSLAAKSSTPSAAAPVAAGTGPVIVIDPGHSPTVNHVDPATGLNDSDYENEPEMRDVFAVAQLVRTQLIAAGYQVVMTKNSATDRVPLGQRAAIANNAHAALAISIHDQAGSSGGIAFASGNNIVYYQSVGDYRATPNGTKVTFTDAALAATSQRYGQVFQTQRAAAEGHTVRAQGDTGYDLGTRGLAAGNIWIVQLLSKVPWIYNEAGGNSTGQSGLNSADMQKYANGLVAGVERCVPL
jgi:N-acetylmuramoyl-L-alanine amidase